jgi:predicted metal-dependent peptidase
MSSTNTISASIYRICKEDPFLGALLQELNFKFSDEVGTACLRYFKESNQFDVILNQKFYDSLTPQERVAILLHEIMHFTHKHTYRFLSMNIQPDPEHPEKFHQKQRVWNVAADMAINQYIPGMPQKSVNVKDFKTKDGVPFPLFQTMETYFRLINENGKENEDILWKYGATGEATDEHVWGDLTEEERQALLEKVKQVVARTIEKTGFGSDRLPEHIKDLLTTVDVTLDKLNYKRILRDVIKKRLVGTDRKHTWLRPSKRYGNFAPGRTNDNLPSLNIYIDSSGSISHTELNEFLTVMNNFLRVGNKACNLYLWHDNIYSHRKHKLNKPFEHSLESGGTNIDCVTENIVDTAPDLAIILTDGYFTKTTFNPTTEVLWIISKNGNAEHPNKHLGKTLPLEGLK